MATTGPLRRPCKLPGAGWAAASAACRWRGPGVLTRVCAEAIFLINLQRSSWAGEVARPSRCAAGGATCATGRSSLAGCMTAATVSPSADSQRAWQTSPSIASTRHGRFHPAVTVRSADRRRPVPCAAEGLRGGSFSIRADRRVATPRRRRPAAAALEGGGEDARNTSQALKTSPRPRQGPVVGGDRRPHPQRRGRQAQQRRSLHQINSTPQHINSSPSEQVADEDQQRVTRSGDQRWHTPRALPMSVPPPSCTPNSTSTGSSSDSVRSAAAVSKTTR